METIVIRVLLVLVYVLMTLFSVTLFYGTYGTWYSRQNCEVQQIARRQKD